MRSIKGKGWKIGETREIDREKERGAAKNKRQTREVERRRKLQKIRGKEEKGEGNIRSKRDGEFRNGMKNMYTK